MPGIVWYLAVAVFFLLVVILSVPGEDKATSDPPLAIGPALLIPSGGKPETRPERP
jgi:hypothetical protein